MRIRLQSTLVAAAVTCSLLAPAAAMSPALAAPTTTSVVTTTAASADAQLQEVDALIAKLEATQTKLTATGHETNYGKEIRELLGAAWQWRTAIVAIAAGGVPPFDPATILPRIQLATEVADTIRIATTEFTNKTNDAHVQIGFAVTRAVIRLANPSGSVDQLRTSITELDTLVEKVRTYPDLTPEDTATIYVKARLDQAIWETRIARDKNILGKVPFAVYHKLNTKITHAVGVQLDPTTTVQQVDDEVAALKAAYAEAEAALP